MNWYSRLSCEAGLVPRLFAREEIDSLSLNEETRICVTDSSRRGVPGILSTRGEFARSANSLEPSSM